VNRSAVWARNERVVCPCCGRRVLINRDGCLRAHHSAEAFIGDSGWHVCAANAPEAVCRFHGMSAAQVAEQVRRGEA
jgi:hypothetical protein